MGRGAPHESTALAGEDRAPQGGVVRALGGSRAESRSDAELVALVRGGDQRAAVELFDRYAPLVRRLLVRSLGPGEEVSDLVQDVFLAVVRGIAGLRDPSALGAFVYGVALNTARMAVRKRARWRWLTFGRERATEPTADPVSYEDRRAVASLYSVLSELGEETRTLFVLRYVEELPTKEVARLLGWSLTTTKRRLERARARFRARALHAPELRSFVGPEDEEEIDG